MRRLRHLLFISLLFALTLPTVIVRADPPQIGGCDIFPADNPWNTDISNPGVYPVHPNSANYIANINAHGGDFVHPDFGSDPTYGIPYTTVLSSQPLVPITFTYDDESDPGPYPFPPTAPVEGGSDHHVIVIETDNCTLYETWDSTFIGGPQNAWTAGSGAIFDLNSNALRPEGWTSADAAGLPILPGLARCDEVMAGAINHALRFTVNHTQKAYIYPARHYASSDTDPNAPPMGLRFRLKADYDISGLSGQALVIAQALKKYGMMIADNGSNWFISGETNPGCWNDDELNQLKDIPGTAFEVVGFDANAAPSRNFYTTGAPTFTWNRVTGAVNYKIQVSGNLAFTGVLKVNRDLPASSLSYTLQGGEALTDGIYYWRVQAQDSSGNWGSWSVTESFIVDV